MADCAVWDSKDAGKLLPVAWLGKYHCDITFQLVCFQDTLSWNLALGLNFGQLEVLTASSWTVISSFWTRTWILCWMCMGQLNSIQMVICDSFYQIEIVAGRVWAFCWLEGSFDEPPTPNTNACNILRRIRRALLLYCAVQAQEWQRFLKILNKKEKMMIFVLDGGSKYKFHSEA